LTQSADKTREESKHRLEKHLSQLWPLRSPLAYRSEEELYNDLRSAWETHWDPPDNRYFDVCCSTTLFSYRVHQFNTTPYPHLFGDMGTGKGRALDLFNYLCYNPLLSSSVSPAAIYQCIDKWHPTLLFDETDPWNAGKEKSERLQAIVQLLNSGYRRGQIVLRASREGSDPIIYDAFGLKIIAGTEPLPRTLADRTIRMDMERNVRNIPLELNMGALEPLRAQLEMYYNAGSHSTADIEAVDQEALKAEIGGNRVTELFHGLYTVCPTAQGRENLLSLAKETVKERQNEEGSSDVAEVLEAIYELCGSPDLTQLSGSLKPKTREISLVTLSNVCRFENKPKEYDPMRWLGYRLKKLQLPRERRKDPDGGSSRVVLVNELKLCRLARRYLPGAFLIDKDSPKPGNPGAFAGNSAPSATSAQAGEVLLSTQGPNGPTSPTSSTSAPPFVTTGSCAVCLQNQPLRPDPRKEFLVCHSCFTTRFEEAAQ
jgi:hypothetical protein